MRRPILLVVLTLSPWCSIAMAQDDSVRGYKAPPTPSIAAPSAPTPIGPRAPAMPGEVLPSRLPDRVALNFAHGYVSRHGEVCDFVFADAGMPEVIAAVSRMFNIVIAYSGGTNREISGRYSGRTATEVLLQLVDRTDLQFSRSGAVWIVEELGDEPPVMLKLDSLEPGSAGHPM